MAQDINLRRLVIKSFHIDTVEWGDHNDVTADGRMTVSRELLDELIEENKDIIEKIDIQIIKPGDHDRWTNTIMDIIPVSTKVLGILGEGITHTLTGVYFMMTGVDVDGVQTYEFGSSEGNLKEKLFLDKAGTPGTNDVIISFDFLFKSHQGQERGRYVVYNGETYQFNEKVTNVLCIGVDKRNLDENNNSKVKASGGHELRRHLPTIILSYF